MRLVGLRLVLFLACVQRAVVLDVREHVGPTTHPGQADRCDDGLCTTPFSTTTSAPWVTTEPPTGAYAVVAGNPLSINTDAKTASDHANKRWADGSSSSSSSTATAAVENELVDEHTDTVVADSLDKEVPDGPATPAPVQADREVIVIFKQYYNVKRHSDLIKVREGVWVQISTSLFRHWVDRRHSVGGGLLHVGIG